MPVFQGSAHTGVSSSADRGRIGRTRAGLGLVIGIAVVAGSLVGCSKDADQTPSIGYAIDNTVTTYNGNTVDGAQSGAQQALARVQPGFSYTGPEGSPVVDTDIGTATQLPGDTLAVQYKINPRAVYSDGVPMTCDDLVLAWAAQSGRFTHTVDGAVTPLFAAANTAGYSDIDRVDCATGSKDATVTFRSGASFTDWRSLFGAGSLMPAHVAARVANVPDLATAVRNSDEESLSRVADFWNTGWKLTPGEVDTAVLPSAGPYKVDSYTDDNGLVLVANDRWWGNRPATPKIVVWPKSDKLSERISDGSVDVVDVAAGSQDLGDDGSAMTSADVPSRNLEQFTMSTSGVFESASARNAFALCVPRDDLFAKFGNKLQHGRAGVGSGVVNARFTPPDALTYRSVAAVAGDRFGTPDPAAAKAALSAGGSDTATVRVGYLGPDSRRSAMVADVAAACAPAGITVQDVSSPGFTPSMLGGPDVDAVLGGTASAQGAAGTQAATTAMSSLRSGSPTNYGHFNDARLDEIIDKLSVDGSTATQLSLSTEAENLLWNDMPTIPLFNQPRTIAFAQGMSAGVVNATRSGAGWNMDRWVLHK